MDAQIRVRALPDRLVAEGREAGLQAAAYADGELVVDAWAGVADRATGRAVDGDTLFPKRPGGEAAAHAVRRPHMR